MGEAQCDGWRPREGRDRFKKFYQQKKLAHGVVMHSKQEWAVINSVRVHTSEGRSRVIKLKHGTECVDGCWSEVTRSIPTQVRRSHQERIATYVNAWAWRARRQGKDLFKALSEELRKM